MVGWMKISVAIITFNEEDRLEATLESCREIADEIVVVDSLSTDGTVEMARRYGAEVFSVPFQDYGTQKNAALDRASHPWVLNLDADERVSDTLKSEIIKKSRIICNGALKRSNHKVPDYYRGIEESYLKDEIFIH